jgi:hypothetical protein
MFRQGIFYTHDGTANTPDPPGQDRKENEDTSIEVAATAHGGVCRMGIYDQFVLGPKPVDEALPLEDGLYSVLTKKRTDVGGHVSSALL